MYLICFAFFLFEKVSDTRWTFRVLQKTPYGRTARRIYSTLTESAHFVLRKSFCVLTDIHAHTVFIEWEIQKYVKFNHRCRIGEWSYIYRDWGSRLSVFLHGYRTQSQVPYSSISNCTGRIQTCLNFNSWWPFGSNPLSTPLFSAIQILSLAITFFSIFVTLAYHCSNTKVQRILWLFTSRFVLSCTHCSPVAGRPSYL